MKDDAATKMAVIIIDFPEQERTLGIVTANEESVIMALHYMIPEPSQTSDKALVIMGLRISQLLQEIASAIIITELNTDFELCRKLFHAIICLPLEQSPFSQTFPIRLGIFQTHRLKSRPVIDKIVSAIIIGKICIWPSIALQELIQALLGINHLP